jgi:hypothetical protein
VIRSALMDRPDEFPTATRQKLLIEICDLMRTPRTQFAQFAEAPQRVNCYVGEQVWRRGFDFPR